MWISEPTPVMSSTNAMDSWSTVKPTSTWNLPTGIQVKRCWLTDRSSALLPSNAMKSTTPTRKDSSAVAQPRMCPNGSVPRPPSSRIVAPSSGSATSSHVRENAPVALTVCCVPSARSSRCTEVPIGSVLEEVGVVDRGRASGAEDGHDDRQADDDLCGRHEHREEREDLSVEVAVHPGERHEGQVAGVQHQLDAHEHHDGVAPEQDPGTADREQQHGDDEIGVRA